MLEQEAEQLLWRLVEAARAVPRSQRGGFIAIGLAGGNTLRHPGFPGGAIDSYDEGDLRDLTERGLVRVTDGGPLDTFELRKEAFDAYDRAHRSAQELVATHERLVTEHVSSEAFASRYRQAFEKWQRADVLLWDDDSLKNLTTIGHLCREAMQLFVARLIERHEVQGADPDAAKTISRLRSVIAKEKPRISSRSAALLDALIGYWEAVNGVVQRQEHGEQKGGEELTWDDGRRVLLHTAMVMSECDRILS